MLPVIIFTIPDKSFIDIKNIFLSVGIEFEVNNEKPKEANSDTIAELKFKNRTYTISFHKDIKNNEIEGYLWYLSNEHQDESDEFIERFMQIVTVSKDAFHVDSRVKEEFSHLQYYSILKNIKSILIVPFVISVIVGLYFLLLN